MQRRKLTDLIKSIQIKQIALPLGYMLLLSIAYNLFYLYISARVTNLWLFYVIQFVLAVVSGVGFYWICTVAWKSENACKPKSILHVLIFQLILVIWVIGILSTFSTMFSVLKGVTLIFQILGVLCMVTMIPVQLVVFHGISQGITGFKNQKQYIASVFKKHSKDILNYYGACLLIVLFMDTILGGIFSISGEIDTCSMASGMLLYGNPMMNCMMTSFMASIYGVGFMDVLAYIVMFIVVGLWYGVLYMNYIVYIQRKCLDDGTRETKTNKKKNRTSK